MGRQSYWFFASISSAVISHDNATFQLPPKPMSSHPRRRSIIYITIYYTSEIQEMWSCGVDKTIKNPIFGESGSDRSKALPVVLMSLSHTGQSLVICPSTSLNNKCKLHHLGCFKHCHEPYIHHLNCFIEGLSIIFSHSSSLLGIRFLHQTFLMPIVPRIRHPKSSFTTFSWLNFANAPDNSDLEAKRKNWTMKSSGNLRERIWNDVQFISCSISIAFLLIFNLLDPLLTPNLPKKPRNRKTSGSSKTWARHGSFNSCNSCQVSSVVLTFECQFLLKPVIRHGNVVVSIQLLINSAYYVWHMFDINWNCMKSALEGLTPIENNIWDDFKISCMTTQRCKARTQSKLVEGFQTSSFFSPSPLDDAEVWKVHPAVPRSLQ